MVGSCGRGPLAEQVARSKERGVTRGMELNGLATRSMIGSRRGAWQTKETIEGIPFPWALL